MKRIHLISTPRNLSTAFMYSWAQRKDTTVVDEPFYAYYLKMTGLDHPGKAEVLESLPQTIEEVIQSIIFRNYSTDVVFFKNMAQHLIGVDLSFTEELFNIIYIRNPKQVISSFAQVIAQPSLQDIGIQQAYEIYQKIGENAIVLDSSQLLKNPESIWRQLCDKIALTYDAGVLSWKAGARKEDGVWAKYWYENVHRSTGFQKQQTSDRLLPKHLVSLYEEALPYYEYLLARSLKA